MALLLRVISKAKWAAPDWMATGDVPADALTDLRADNNELSVWGVESDRSNLNTALAAVASNRERLDKLDYTLLDETILPAIPIRCLRSDGSSPHLIASTTMHRDLVELTVKKIAHLAHEMMTLERIRVTRRQVELLLREALQSRALDRASIKPTLLSEIETAA
jgi:hypothetical protein